MSNTESREDLRIPRSDLPNYLRWLATVPADETDFEPTATKMIVELANRLDEHPDDILAAAVLEALQPDDLNDEENAVLYGRWCAKGKP